MLFRTEGGALGALDAHCPHMGAHLRHASVVGEELRCPLHHWSFGVGGGCRGAGAAPSLRAPAWAVRERFGLIFLFLGDGTPSELPTPAGSEGLSWTTARPVRLDASWHSMMVNGFDLLHLGAVHQRALAEDPVFQGDGRSLTLRYVSRVTGRGLSDRLMRLLSGDRIRVEQTCFGPTIFISSRVGSRRTCAVLGLLPDGRGVRAHGAFGVERGPIAPLRLFLARWLFMAFLRRDFAVVEGMKLRLDGVEDRGVRQVADFLRSLPEVARPASEELP